MKLKDYQYEIKGVETESVYKELVTPLIWLFVYFQLIIIVVCTISLWIVDYQAMTIEWRIGLDIACILIVAIFWIKKRMK